MLVEYTVVFSETSEEIILTVGDVVLEAKNMFVLTFDTLEMLKDCDEGLKSCVTFVEMVFML